ncbi:hypothetical protein GCM10010112_86740 [Actinoplanes lobatus]|uniref:Uncharacterized protein n=1 Tax=Actinoplanes lobatus TaxID=113568 RepID=A0A7W7HC24_9ACTN|nr:hypothetical protein [Actinoplanes lobatus]MBB4747786.1 hypothetical protein [Actinoplanes lobatus]GGN95943.1 hypothetical protein GCM10010112_86740 [Actinoplanes lobatus]GIE45138.1 hypothetical protein Alo02nite_80360 [Actinoplanes lobatus]
MSRFVRWQIASVFIVFSGLALGLTVLGALAYWSGDSPLVRTITAFMCLLFASCVGLGISIGATNWDDGFPWRRALTLLLFLVLGFGVGWARSAVA